jgi:hypothetical protein
MIFCVEKREFDSGKLGAHRRMEMAEPLDDSEIASEMERIRQRRKRARVIRSDIDAFGDFVTAKLKDIEKTLQLEADNARDNGSTEAVMLSNVRLDNLAIMTVECMSALNNARLATAPPSVLKQMREFINSPLIEDCYVDSGMI